MASASSPKEKDNVTKHTIQPQKHTTTSSSFALKKRQKKCRSGILYMSSQVARALQRQYEHSQIQLINKRRAWSWCLAVGGARK